MKTPILVNAAEIARERPATFERPSADLIARIHAGNMVKLSVGAEWLWVEVVSRNEAHFVGRVATLLVSTAWQGLTVNDQIEFHADNIYAFTE